MYHEGSLTSCRQRYVGATRGPLRVSGMRPGLQALLLRRPASWRSGTPPQEALRGPGGFKPHAMCPPPQSSKQGLIHPVPEDPTLRVLPPTAETQRGRAYLHLPLPGSDGSGRQTAGPLGAGGVAGGAAARPSRSQHALRGRAGR